MGDSEGLRVEATKLTLEIKQFIKRERIASPGSMQDTGSLGLVHWDDPEGWYGVGDGRVGGWGTRVHPWRMHVDVWQNQYNIVK